MHGLYVICYANISIFGVKVNVTSVKIGNVNISRVKKVGLNNMMIYSSEFYIAAVVCATIAFIALLIAICSVIDSICNYVPDAKIDKTIATLEEIKDILAQSK